jgi:hypothetical protein
MKRFTLALVIAVVISALAVLYVMPWLTVVRYAVVATLCLLAIGAEQGRESRRLVLDELYEKQGEPLPGRLQRWVYDTMPLRLRLASSLKNAWSLGRYRDLAVSMALLLVIAGGLLWMAQRAAVQTEDIAFFVRIAHAMLAVAGSVLALYPACYIVAFSLPTPRVLARIGAQK